MPPEIPGCSKTGCVMWWMAITLSTVDIFIKDIGLDLPIQQSPASRFAIGLNSIEYVHQRQ